MNTIIKENTKIVIHTDKYEDGLIDSIKYEVLSIFDEIHLMPDTHVGKSVPIGFVAKFDDKILPDIVGVDIGCGVTTVVIPKTANITEKLTYDNFKKLDNYIRQNLGRVHLDKIVNDDVIPLLKRLSFELEEDRKNYHRLQVGTLGSGNHFVEFNEDEENYYLTVHSGSRYLGQVVNKYHNTKLGFDVDNYVLERNKIVEELKAQGRDTEISAELNKLKQSDKYSYTYLSGELLDNYLNDVDVCIKYAQMSRKEMILTILKYLKLPTKLEYIDTTHNYIDLENQVIHKGSIRAKKGEKVVIPINMRDGMIIGVGKSNEEWMSSAPHGAGRILSRTKAKEELSYKEFKKQMEGITTFSVKKSTLDEAPDSYRSIEEIQNHIVETVDIISVAKVIYNYKG